ncbi:hypothetical protein ACSSS7_002564 [Eimeria intestinalis]
MASSPSASPFSVGSDNSTECFRGASSQQMSFEGHTDDAAWIPDEILSYQPKPTEILKPSPGGGPPVRLIFGDLDLLPHEVEGLNELRKLIENDKELAESTLFADDRYCVRFLQGQKDSFTFTGATGLIALSSFFDAKASLNPTCSNTSSNGSTNSSVPGSIFSVCLGGAASVIVAFSIVDLAPAIHNYYVHAE